MKKKPYRHLFKYKKELLFVTVLLILGSFIQLIFPFLTQAIVDRGIANNDLDFITLILLCQIALFLGGISMDFVRNWIMMHVGIRIGINLSDEYISNILNKQVHFLNARKAGDFLQRTIDIIRVERFMTNDILLFTVAIINLFVFGIVLFLFKWEIFALFFVTSVLSVFWLTFFLNRRKEMDNQRFVVSGDGRNKFLEIIFGIEEIKFNNLQDLSRIKWLNEQSKLLKIRLKLLLLSQYQVIGAQSINQFKNIFITFLSAKYVLSGDITLGEMLAIQYLLGQLRQPVNDISQFIQSNQDADLSVGRLNEVKNPETDQPTGELVLEDYKKEIVINDLQLNINKKRILKGINLRIPYGQHIAIVGESGSGKTTLVKAICKLIPPTAGAIFLEDWNLSHLENRAWVDKLSIVAQDGFIFNESLEFNIALTDEDTAIDYTRLESAITMSNMSGIIRKLPQGSKTIIGKGGAKMSKGESQRILIARAIYKGGDFLVLDEASSALDNITEAKVIFNLLKEFGERTIISVAHKLNTIKNADIIILMKDGSIIEQGSHEELMNNKKEYYSLVMGAE